MNAPLPTPPSGTTDPASAEATRCGILLHPAGHTLSPVLHAAAFRELGLEARYDVYDVRPESLMRSLAELFGAGVRQLSVSLPHKEAVVGYADSVSDAVCKIGAANTLTRDGDRIRADNTDWIGVVRSLEPHGDWEGKRALVLGAGGAARAVVYALTQLGCPTRVWNRTPERAQRLAAELGVEAELDLPSGTQAAPYDVLVNTTSVGMQPHVDASPAPASALRPEALVFDIVYAPLETRLLREARARGCRTQDGLDMLVHQAVEQVRLWAGRAPTAAELRKAAERALGIRSRTEGG